MHFAWVCLILSKEIAIVGVAKVWRQSEFTSEWAGFRMSVAKITQSFLLQSFRTEFHVIKYTLHLSTK